MSRRLAAIAVPVGLILPAWLVALYIVTNVATNCPSATGWAIMAGQSRCAASLAYTVTHPTPWWGFNHHFGPLLVVALVVVPVVAAISLERRLLRST